MPYFKLFVSYLVSIILLIFFHSAVIAQEPAKLDSLTKALQNVEDIDKARIYNLLAEEYRRTQADSAIKYGLKALELAAQYQQPKAVLEAHNILGLAYKKKGLFPEAEQYFKEGYEKSLSHKNLQYQAKLSGNLGGLLIDLGELEESLEYLIISLKAEEKSGNNSGIIISYITIGVVYAELSETEKALDYFELANLTSIDAGNKNYEQYCQNNIGMIYQGRSEFEKALPYFLRSLELAGELGIKSSIGSSWNSIGGCYLEMKEYEKAITALEKALSIREEIKDLRGIAVTKGNIGEYYYLTGQKEKGVKFLNEGLKMSEELNLKTYIRDFNKLLAELYTTDNRYKEANQHLIQYMAVKDSLLNEDRLNQISEMEAKYENEKKQQEIEILNKDKALQAVEIEKNKTQKNFTNAGIIFLLLILGIIIWSYWQKRKANTLLENKNKIIAEKNKAITDSIQYAKRIQDGIIPDDELMQQHLPDHFVIYKPRDIVSGDFYWIMDKGDHVFFAVVDCTGHGVPGAMVSMVSNNGLNRFIRGEGLQHPAEILDNLNIHIEETFRMQVSYFASEPKEKVKDGMDISLCKLEKATNKLEFAGAFNSLWLIRNKELIEYKADRQSVGANEKKVPFTNHHIQLEKHDRFYLMTDGFADQFGGAGNKKFSKKRLKEKLLEIHLKSMEQQQQALEQTLISWQNNHPQIDDICLMGVNIN